MIGRNDVTGPRDVKITHFPRSPWRCAVASADLETRQSAARADRFLFLGIFRTVPRPFPVSLFLSLLLSFFFWDWEVSVSFYCLTSLFVCAHAQAYLFCSGWRLDFPAPFSLLSTFPSKNTQAWRVLIAGWFLRHMYSLTKWKCDSDAVMLEYKLPTRTDASLLSRWLRCLRAASQQLIDRWRTRSWNPRSRMKTTRTPRYLIADLKSHVKLALPCELTRQNRHVHAGLPRRRTTTRSPRVRLNSKLSKATLTSRTEKIRRQNIRLNSCSFILKERSDSDDMVRQKSSKKQRKSLAGDVRDADVFQVRDRGACSCTARRHVRGMLRYSMTTKRKVKDLCSPRGAKKKVLLGTSSTVTLLEKNHAREVGQFWNLAGIFLDYRRIIQT